MAHNISFANGRYEVMTRGSSWHELGTVVNDAQTAAETIQQAGLGWQVVKTPLYDAQGNELPTFGIFRDDNNAFLGTVGNQYTPIQNRFQFDFVDKLLEADGRAHYESAGALGKGERVWVMANLGNETEVVPGDTSKNYLAFVNSHDGSMSAKAFLTQVRIVCQNTLNMALGQAKDVVNVKHTKNAEIRLSQARSLFQGARQTAESIQGKLRILATKKLRPEDYQSVVHRLFYAGKSQKEIDADKRTENLLTGILERYDYNDNNTFPEIRGTAYNLFNAITEHTDHYRNVRQTSAKGGWTESEIRANNALFGSGAELKNKALEVILESTAYSPTMSSVAYSVPSYGNKSALDSILAQY